MNTVQKPARVCIVGGGPAGMILGLLLARAGIKATVLEKHSDFFRDFRGDTVHPSTFEIFYELGLLERFLARPHQKAERVSAVVGGHEVAIGDFSHLPGHAPYIGFMPQWEFLDFVREVASESDSFELLMETAATDLMVQGDRVVGVRAVQGQQEFELRADLVVACDGRQSLMRAKAGLTVHDLGAPIDVLWMRISRQPDDPPQLFGRFDQGLVFVMLNRQDYWQCAYVIDKGSLDQIRAQGLPAFQHNIRRLAPFLGSRVEELAHWDDIKLLTVRVDRLEQWAREGLLFIGDAAHAMSPVGGVGINLAIQDAVAAANILTEPLLQGRCTLADLNKVQKRRMLPTRLTQAAQVQAHKRVLKPVLGSARQLKVPLPLRLAERFPWLRRIPARLIGIGIRPERPDTNLFPKYS